MASIVVVSMLVVILALISAGFARLMSRALSDTVNSQLGSAGFYVARSGISDAAAFLAANPGFNAGSCDVLLGDNTKPLQSASQNISDSSGGTAAYTCILIDNSPTRLIYQKIPAYESQVAKLDPESGSLQSLTISWQSTDASNNQTNCNLLYTQTEWSSRLCEPLLRITLFRIAGDGDSLDNIENNTKTFFLIPGGATNSVNFNGTATGSVLSVSCPNPPGSNQYHCSVRVVGLGSGEYFYARLTPLYQQADIQVEGIVTGNDAAQFVGAQAVIDVTAKASSSVRRLAARVDTSSPNNQVNVSPSDDAMPEFAIRSAGTLCKRLLVNGSITVDPSAPQALCNLSL
jgi:hypothetical protein